MYLGTVGCLHHITALCAPQFVLSSETRRNCYSTLSPYLLLANVSGGGGSGERSLTAVRIHVCRVYSYRYADHLLTERVQRGTERGGTGVIGPFKPDT